MKMSLGQKSHDRERENREVSTDISADDKRRINEALFEACRRGLLPDVERALNSGADSNARDEDDSTPLIEASLRGYHQIVRLLLAHGADVLAQDSSGWTARIWADYCGHEQIAVYLSAVEAEHLSELGRALFQACREGLTEDVARLLSKGATLNGRDEKDVLKETPLIAAVRNGHEDIARMLIEQGANLELGDCVGETPLMRAAADGQENILKLLLERGANVDARNEDGMTALMIAAAWGRSESVRILLDVGADDIIRCGGRTALDYAVASKATEVEKLLRTHHGGNGCK